MIIKHFSYIAWVIENNLETLKVYKMSKFGALKDLVMSLEADFSKFYEKGNSAAGTRVRKGMQDLKNMAQDIRKEVQDMKNS